LSNRFNKIDKYKPYIPEKSFGELRKDVTEGNIDVLILSKDLTTIYSEKDLETTIDDFEFDDLNLNNNLLSVTNSHPVLANSLIELAESKGIDSIILQEPPTVTSPYGFIPQFFDNPLVAFFVPLLVFSLIRSFFANPQNPQSMMGFGNNFKIQVVKPDVKLSDWAGSPEIFRECSEIVSYIRNKTNYVAMGAEIPKGILLEGEPGTGKTLIAKAIANEADCNFIALSASEFVELFVGLGSLKVRNLFAEARKNSPCIIFIDEIDAVGRKRGSGFSPGGNDEREQTLNQLLFEMDGFNKNEGIIVMAATNRRDVLDPALLRPGRFDRIVNVPLPDMKSRISLFQKYLENKKLDERISVDQLSEVTEGFSGADIKNLINEAAILAAREGRTILIQGDIENALEKKTIGIVKEDETRSKATLERVAIHEVGHAMMAVLFRRYFDLKKVTIQSTYSGAGGYTLFTDLEKEGMYTRDMLHKRIVVALGGKAAEEVFYGKYFVSVGASQDLKQANELARRMVSIYGMGEEARSVSLEGGSWNSPTYSEETIAKIDKEAAAIVEDCYRIAVSLLQEKREVAGVLVDVLKERTVMRGFEVEAIVLGSDSYDKKIQEI
jgi:cell division protease FtsH